MKLTVLMLLFVYQPTVDNTKVAQTIELQQDVCDGRDNNCPDPEGFPDLKAYKDDPSYEDFDRLLNQIRMDIEGIDVEEEQGRCPNLSGVWNMECV